MVAQYPYTLEVLVLSGGGYDNAGNPIDPTESWQVVSKCRDEAGNGKKVSLTDNSVYEYAFLIQLPRGVEAVEAGTKVRVVNRTEVRCSGDVVYSRKDQLHSRIWV